MRARHLAPLLLALAAGCGETLVDHRAPGLFGGCNDVDACGPECVPCTAAPANSVPACLGQTGQEFCSFACTGGFLKCAGDTACCPAKAVAAGAAHTCAIADAPDADALFCWGDNSSGQAVPTIFSAAYAIPAKIRDGIKAVALGEAHTCAIVAGPPGVGDTVECWGAGFGRVPQPIGVANAVELAAGAAHTCAIDSSKAVKCWGSNELGQRGGPGVGTPPIATPVPSGADHLSAGANHTCAVEGNAVVCWGSNAFGQLGDPAVIVSSETAVTVGGLTGIGAVAAGGNRTCATKPSPNGTFSDALQCWGDGPGPTFGLAEPQPTPAIPMKIGVAPTGVPVAATATAIATGRTHTCFRTGTGVIECFGPEFSRGQLGGTPAVPVGGTPGVRSETVKLTQTQGALGFAAGSDHSCAILSTGGVFCWGENASGQLGDGTRSTPGVDDGRSFGVLVPVSGR